MFIEVPRWPYNPLEVSLDARSYWLGLRAASSDPASGFVWITGENASYTDWGRNQPSGHGHEQCVTINGHDHYQWYEISCGLHLHFICEHPASFGPSTTNKVIVSTTQVSSTSTPTKQWTSTTNKVTVSTTQIYSTSTPTKHPTGMCRILRSKSINNTIY